MFIPVRSSKYPAMQLLFLNFSSIVLTKMKKSWFSILRKLMCKLLLMCINIIISILMWISVNSRACAECEISGRRSIKWTKVHLYFVILKSTNANRKENIFPGVMDFVHITFSEWVNLIIIVNSACISARFAIQNHC